MANGDQVKNGKAFEYAIALEYYRYLRSKDIKVEFLEDKAFKTARSFFNGFDEEQQQLFCLSARASIKTMLKLESGFTSPKNEKDVLTIQVASDKSGEEGKGTGCQQKIAKGTMGGGVVTASAEKSGDHLGFSDAIEILIHVIIDDLYDFIAITNFLLM